MFTQGSIFAEAHQRDTLKAKVDFLSPTQNFDVFVSMCVLVGTQFLCIGFGSLLASLAYASYCHTNYFRAVCSTMR